jgi:hypothetical protein
LAGYRLQYGGIRRYEQIVRHSFRFGDIHLDGNIPQSPTVSPDLISPIALIAPESVQPTRPGTVLPNSDMSFA